LLLVHLYLKQILETTLPRTYVSFAGIASTSFQGSNTDTSWTLGVLNKSGNFSSSTVRKFLYITQSFQGSDDLRKQKIVVGNLLIPSTATILPTQYIMIRVYTVCCAFVWSVVT